MVAELKIFQRTLGFVQKLARTYRSGIRLLVPYMPVWRVGITKYVQLPADKSVPIYVEINTGTNNMENNMNNNNDNMESSDKIHIEKCLQNRRY